MAVRWVLHSIIMHYYHITPSIRCAVCCDVGWRGAGGGNGEWKSAWAGVRCPSQDLDPACSDIFAYSYGWPRQAATQLTVLTSVSLHRSARFLSAKLYISLLVQYLSRIEENLIELKQCKDAATFLYFLSFHSFNILEKRRPIGRFSLGPAGTWGASPLLV